MSKKSALIIGIGVNLYSYPNKINKLNNIRTFKKNTKEIDGKGLFRVNKILIDYING